jgi:hypothetical protein
MLPLSPAGWVKSRGGSLRDSAGPLEIATLDLDGLVQTEMFFYRHDRSRTLTHLSSSLPNPFDLNILIRIEDFALKSRYDGLGDLFCRRNRYVKTYRRNTYKKADQIISHGFPKRRSINRHSPFME